MLLKVLQSRASAADRITLVYNSASDYSVGLSGESKWLSKGILEVRSVLGYGGHIIPTRKLHLIVLAGFESERAEQLIEAYEPAKISLGCGDPVSSISATHYSVNKSFYKKLAEKLGTVSPFTFSCSDPFATKAAVEKQISKFSGYNIVVAPLNTKVSTVGVGLAALEDDSIQVCYASAKQYNYLAYSVPSNDCYIFDNISLAKEGVLPEATQLADVGD